MARLIKIWYNITKKILQDTAGNQLDVRYYEGVVYQEKSIMQLQLVVDSLNTPYTGIASLSVFSASIDNDFDQTTNLMVKTLNADINVAGDWVSGGNADHTQGQFSIRIDANTTGFIDKIGLERILINTNFELKVLDSITSDLSFRISFSFYTYNLQDINGAVPPTPPLSDYYTKIENDAALSLKQDLVSLATAGHIAIFDANGQVVDGGLPSAGGTVQDVATLTIRATDEGNVAGDTRGANSVDLQTSKSNASQIANGIKSTLLGGTNNGNLGDQAVLVGGGYNTAQGAYSFVGGGFSNDAIANYSVIPGGYQCSTTGQYSMAQGVYCNTSAYVEVNFGAFSFMRTGQSASTQVGTDNLFALGNGANAATTHDAFRVLKNGSMLIGLSGGNAFVTGALDDGLSLVSETATEIIFDVAKNGVTDTTKAIPTLPKGQARFSGTFTVNGGANTATVSNGIIILVV